MKTFLNYFKEKRENKRKIVNLLNEIKHNIDYRMTNYNIVFNYNKIIFKLNCMGELYLTSENHANSSRLSYKLGKTGRKIYNDIINKTDILNTLFNHE